MTKAELEQLKPGDRVYMRIQFHQYKEKKITFVPVDVLSTTNLSVWVKLPNGQKKLCHDFMLYSEPCVTN